MPLIIFNFENGRKIVKKYIDREMYLYLWKMNFRNWDYYVVNYLFSFKHFRYIIESLFSKNKTQKIETESIMDQIMNSKRRKKTFDINDEVIFLSSLRSHSSNCKNIATYSFITDEFRNTTVSEIDLCKYGDEEITIEDYAYEHTDIEFLKNTIRMNNYIPLESEERLWKQNQHGKIHLMN